MLIDGLRILNAMVNWLVAVDVDSDSITSLQPAAVGLVHPTPPPSSPVPASTPPLELLLPPELEEEEGPPLELDEEGPPLELELLEPAPELELELLDDELELLDDDPELDDWRTPLELLPPELDEDVEREE
jgi:hypothetical protein